jgi:chromosome segregation protein
MVRIEKLEMQNFKSFARKTIVTFPGNFLVICGPNASGKSNILDAICFVLGRISAKSLRAHRMLEMIFHGSKSKPPAEFAKVSIYFDNSDKVFPVDEEKICITRRINRKGISNYKLNGKTVTRETILEILRPARIRPDGHNIILQGDVTNVIEMSPLERREIIDEISGIKEFDEKKKKAENELLTVEERLKEASIILNERRSNLERLEMEMKAAKKYQKLTEELDKLRASLAKQKLREAEEAMKKLDEKVKKIQEEDFDEKIESVNREIESVERRMNEIDKRLLDRSRDIAIIKEAERIRAEINRKKDRIDFNKIEIERLENLIKRLEVLKQREFEGSLSKAVQEVLKLGWAGIYGTIASLSKVPREYQIAIEVAAGPHLQDIVVSNEDVAIECVKYLKKNRIGRATFLPLDKIRERDNAHLKKFLKEEGVIGIAIDLIKFNKKYYKAFSFVFGDTLIVKNIDVAKKIGIGKTRFVTLDGDLIERSGVIVGGHFIGKKVFFEKEEIEKYKERKKKIEKELEDLKKEISKLQKELEYITAEEKLESKELLKLQEERKYLEKRYEELKKRIRELIERKESSRERINNLRIKKARLEAELENLKSEFQNYKMKETYNIPPRLIEKRIKETISAIDALGPINMKALEEYEKQKVLYDDLKGKVDKLTEERNKILEIIAEIEGKRKETFMKTLEGIREQFKIVFRDLTGGDADLRLSGGLDSGLLIEASPGGKKLLNIDAMSGGEKTLTALAFLFAIQRYKPAPFYILDEVDAALDKRNTKKIVELIKKYSSDSQFIVISHNDITIQEADCVYGVSMEDGESKIVGIKMPT